MATRFLQFAKHFTGVSGKLNKLRSLRNQSLDRIRFKVSELKYYHQISIYIFIKAYGTANFKKLSNPRGDNFLKIYIKFKKLERVTPHNYITETIETKTLHEIYEFFAPPY